MVGTLDILGNCHYLSAGGLEHFLFLFFFWGGGHELKLGPIGGQTIISSSVGGSLNQMSDFPGG